ncbi:MAG: Ig-like domain-containing protein [Bradymonadaceae bacterium]|nr:Ig-like domain-containing protein [Lujinxingiaceae bacterium]
MAFEVDVPFVDDASDLDVAIDVGDIADIADIANDPIVFDVLDVDPGEQNGCGGLEALLFEGAAAAPGAACGECADGVLVCDGADALRCLGASAQNVCGGCAVLVGMPDQACGRCGDGIYTCSLELPELACLGASAINACGGCATLAGEPGHGCTTAGGVAGIFACTGGDAVRCVGAGENVCGGTGVLSARPGTPCGACNLGVVSCDGLEATRCEGDDAGLNACGGCMLLSGEPETDCGLCAGEWTCDGADGVVCGDASRNACNGCADLGEGHPGEACSEFGVFVCASEDTMVCPLTATNACGGQSTLDALPGDACGSCGDGRVVCASPEAVACIGARAQNACGGCALLPGTPDEPCGAGAVWTCTEDAKLACTSSEDRNACGGGAALSSAPGAICGPCNLDIVQCSGPNAVACSGQTPCKELELETKAVTGISATAATFHGLVSELPVAVVFDHGFCFAHGGGQQTCRSLAALTTAKAFSHFETTLLPGRTYVVRAYGETLAGRVYANEVSFTTLAPAVTGLTASKGSSVAHVALAWQAIVGSSEYVVYRDGVEVARVSGNASAYLDQGADVGSLPTVVSAFAATKGTHTDFVRLSWQAATAAPGASHSYTVKAVYPSLESALSSSAVGNKGADPISGYALSIDGAPFVSVGAVLQYDDTSAPDGTIVPSLATASAGSIAAHVRLALSGPAEVQTASVRYVLRATNARGSGANSAEQTGYRGVTGVGYQWQRSAGDSDANYADLVGATLASFDDTGAPSDGSARYYRARIDAAGAPTEFSNSVRGFRAVQGQVATLDPLSRAPDDITPSSATLWGELTTVGVPTPAAMGFCYHHTIDSPTHADINDGAICVAGTPRDATDEFFAEVADLEAGTTYFVRAFVLTIAEGTGYAYGQVVFFDTRTTAPQNVTTESAVAHVTVSFDAVFGATDYRIVRDAGTANEAVVDATLLDLGNGRLGVEDQGASAGGLPTAPSLSATGGSDALSGAIKLSWNLPSVPAGAEHTYTVVAIGQDALESAQSTPATPGRRLGAPVTGYEVKIGAANFVLVAHSAEGNALVWLDDSASWQGGLSVDAILVSKGDHPDRVTLTAQGGATQDGQSVSYQVRAVNSLGATGAASASTSGNRTVGTINYQWFYSDSGAVGSFTALTTPPSVTAASATDTGPAPGVDRHYYVELSAAGANNVASAVETGYRARAATVTTGAVAELTTSSARFEGQITDVGRPTVTEHGFCYAPSSAACTSAGATCTTRGASSSTAAYFTTVTLTAGTSYNVCAYATNNAATSYGAQRAFSTLSSAPTNLTATQGTIEAHVLVGFDAVAGAKSYALYREDAGGVKVLVTTITVTDAGQTSYSFEDADAALIAPAPLAPVLDLVTNMTDRVRIAWLGATTPSGAAHTYTVVAVNDAGSSASSAPANGWRAPRTITGYEVRARVGDAAFGAWADASNGANHFHDDLLAPAGTIQIVPDSASASDGTHTAYVALSTGAATGQPGTLMTYEVRAKSVASPGAALPATGRRTLGAIGYQWERSDDNTTWAPIAGATTREYNDTSALLADGLPRYYRVIVSATGASSVTQHAGTGFRAVLHLVFDVDPSETAGVAGTTFAVAVGLLNQDGVPMALAGVPIDLELNGELVDAQGDPLASLTSVTNASGQAQFFVRILEAATDYVLTATSTDARFSGTAVDSELFAITPATPSPLTSTIAATGPIVANGTASSTVTITLRDVYANPISGVTPTFSASGTGNTVGTCGATSTAGVATCTLRSTVAELKTLAISSPAALTGVTTTVTFTAGAAAAANSTIAATGPVIANGTASSTVTITLRDANTNPIPGVTPTFSASGTGNTVGTCGATSTAGVSTCSLQSTVAELKTLAITSPADLTTVTTTVSFVPGPASPAGSTITAQTRGFLANGTDAAVVTITLRDAHGNLVSGVQDEPTFKANPDDDVDYGQCQGVQPT